MGTVGLEGPRQRVLGIPKISRESPSAAASLAESSAAIVFSFAAVACAAHLLFAGRYGYFRDELYYAACGEHLAWGYVDHAPLIALIARVTRALLGDSLYALRILPALSAAAKIIVTAWMVRELGGRRFAQILTATCVLFAPIYLTFDSFLSMNAFEPIFWMLCAAIFMRIVRGGDERLWVLGGFVAGLGFLNKHSMAFFCAAMFLGILLTPERRVLRSRWFWIGASFALLLMLPNILWEARHGWPTIEILRIVRQIKNAPVTPLQFILQQALLIHPLETPVWLSGLGFFFFARDGRQFRALGWAYLVVMTDLILLKGKIYYLAPIYPMLLAAGAVQIDAWVRQRDWPWLKPAIVVPIIIGGLIAAPLAMPILPVEKAVTYTKFWDVEKVQVEKMPLSDLPQFFGDMFGWQTQAAAVARVYHSLPPADRAKTGILAWNFGQAGAIDYFGPALGLPKAISGHNNYYLWGTHGASGEVMIAFGVPLEKLQESWGSVVQVDVIQSPYAIPEETGLPVYICRQPMRSFRESWPLFHWLG
jgi:hypothetical protein